MDDLIKYLGKTALLLGVLFGSIIGISRGCNVHFNSYETKTSKYHTVSKATGVGEHIDYTKYDDGTEEVRVRPGLRLNPEKIYSNSGQDNKVDRIRNHSNHTGKLELFIRETDYENNKEEFDKADQLLLEYRAMANK